VSEFLAGDFFRFIGLPISAAVLGCWVKYFMARLRTEPITAEVFSVWLELTIVSLFNLLTAASQAAIEASKNTIPPHLRHAYDEFLLTSVVIAAVVVLWLWLVSFTTAHSRTLFGQYLWPHLAALGVLVAVMLFASRPLP
jgi:hypothetical protein